MKCPAVLFSFGFISRKRGEPGLFIAFLFSQYVKVHGGNVFDQGNNFLCIRTILSSVKRLKVPSALFNTVQFGMGFLLQPENSSHRLCSQPQKEHLSLINLHSLPHSMQCNKPTFLHLFPVLPYVPGFPHTGQ